MEDWHITVRSHARVVTGIPPAKAERLFGDPRIGVVHSTINDAKDRVTMRTIVFVPDETADG